MAGQGRFLAAHFFGLKSALRPCTDEAQQKALKVNRTRNSGSHHASRYQPTSTHSLMPSIKSNRNENICMKISALAATVSSQCFRSWFMLAHSIDRSGVPGQVTWRLLNCFTPMHLQTPAQCAGNWQFWPHIPFELPESKLNAAGRIQNEFE